MNELIKITVNGDKQAVSARELYDFLGLDKSQWARWYKTNIVNNGFAIENEDWVGFDVVSSSNNGIPTMDFSLSIDFAKRLAMMTRSEKGEEVRKYFIECERKAKELLQPKTQLEVLYEIVGRMVQIEKLEAQNAKEIKELDSRVSEVEAKQITINTDYYTVAGYCKLIGKSIDKQSAAKLGKECSNLSRNLSIGINKAYDSKYGEVNTYHKEILKKCFDSLK